MPGDGWLRQKFRKFAEEMEKADERNFLKNFDGAGGKLA